MQNGTDGVDYGRSVNRDAPLSNAAKHQMKPWEIIADNLKKAGWSWGCVGALDTQGRTIWIADAHRDTESVSSCVQTKSLARLLNLNAKR